MVNDDSHESEMDNVHELQNKMEELYDNYVKTNFNIQMVQIFS